MKGRLLRILSLGISVTIISMLVPLVNAEEVPRMTKEDLKAMLGDPNVVILDVRADIDWDESDRKVKGAIREDPELLEDWAHKYSKDKTLVFYCA